MKSASSFETGKSCTNVEQSVEAHKHSRLRTFYYWVALIATLLVVDDATFGWIFWGLSQVNPFLSAAVAFAVYWLTGYWITMRGLTPNPGKVAGWFLRKLQLGHKNPELHQREIQLQLKITSVAAAIPMSLLLGGVFTTLWLCRRDIIDKRQARWWGWWLSGLYALEVAAIHGLGIGGSLFWMRH